MDKVRFRNVTVWAIFAHVTLLTALIAKRLLFLLVTPSLVNSCLCLLLSLVLGEGVFFALFA
jgi:hypothetical protein